MSLTDGCRNEPAEQHGIVGGKVGGKRMVFRIVFNQFLVGIYPQMTVHIKLQLIDNVSVQLAQAGMIRQFFVCKFKAYTPPSCVPIQMRLSSCILRQVIERGEGIFWHSLLGDS